MEGNKSRLRELREELDRTYKEMKEILQRNNITRKMVSTLPKEEYTTWNNLNQKSIQLINEFIVELGNNINK